MIYVNLRKGNLLLVGQIWYVLVGVIWSRETKKMHLLCICDHANNVHSWEMENVEAIVDTRRIGWKRYDDMLHKRPCPFDIIAEVLNGDHDDRFDELNVPDEPYSIDETEGGK